MAHGQEKIRQRRRLVFHHNIANLPEHGAFARAFLAFGLRGCNHAASQTGKGKRLDPDFPGSSQRCEKHAFAAKQDAFDIAGLHQIEIDARGIGGHAAGIDMQLFARCQFTFDQRPAHLHKDPAIALKLLHDEAFAAEKPCHYLALKFDANGNALGCGQKAVFLTNQRSAEIGKLERQDGAGNRRAKGHSRLTAAIMGENRREQALAGDQPFARTEQLVHETALLLLPAAIAEHGGHFDRRILPDHSARLCNGAFTGIQFDLDKLQLLALDLIVNFVVAHDRIPFPARWLGVTEM